MYSGGPGGGAGSYAGAGGNQVPNGKAYEITRKDDSQGRLATVHIRYQTPDRQRAPEQARDVVEPRQAASSSRLALAGTVAEFAEVLKHSYWARGITLKQVADAANTRLAGRSDQQVQELLGLLQKAAALEDVPRPVADGTIGRLANGRIRAIVAAGGELWCWFTINARRLRASQESMRSSPG